MTGLTQHTDIEEFEQAVKASDDEVLEVSDSIKGTPMGCTVEDLIDCAETFADSLIVTTDRAPAPVPVGASFTLEQLHDVADLLNTLGTGGITDINKRDDGTICIGYHFD